MSETFNVVKILLTKLQVRRNLLKRKGLKPPEDAESPSLESFQDEGTILNLKAQVGVSAPPFASTSWQKKEKSRDIRP
jgi:hypothetical protein